MVDFVICQNRLFDRQPVSLPLKTLGFLCFKTEGQLLEWHIRACGDNQVDKIKTTVKGMTVFPTYTPPDLAVETSFWKTDPCIHHYSDSVIQLQQFLNKYAQ